MPRRMRIFRDQSERLRFFGGSAINNNKQNRPLLHKIHQRIETTTMLSRTFIRRLPASKAVLARSLSTQALNLSRNNASANQKQNLSWLGALSAIGASIAIGTSMTFLEAPHFRQPDGMIQSDTPTSIKKHPAINSPPERPDLPVFTREEVAEHCGEESLWYTFRGGVYDLTSFYQGHPGGAPVCSVALPKSLNDYEVFSQNPFLAASSYGSWPGS